MSTHQVNVVRVAAPTPHPNADALEILTVYGYTCVVRKGEWHEGDLAVYVEPDYVVDSRRTEFAFLAPMLRHEPGPERIRVKRLRGVVSQGLIVPAPPDAREGDDVMERLGIERYVPPADLATKGDNEKPPPGYAPVYDVESFRRYPHAWTEGEPVVVTEKIHGANARFTFRAGRMWCGSRTGWKAQDAKSLWWAALAQNPWIETACRAIDGGVVYGEVFGQVQDLKYGARQGQVFFRAFDVLIGNAWVPAAEHGAYLAPEHRAPVVYEGPLSFALLDTWADGRSLVPGADHIREGVVIRPRVERTHPEIGRVIGKVVSNRYLERA